jgi:peptidoglycan/xylan/chitin deacetylase (PgdA/CDA1 family)
MFCTVRIRWEIMFIVITAVVLLFCGIIFAAAYEPVSQEEGIAVPIIMYHSILKDDSMHGKYVASPIDVENDILYLKQQGYKAVFVNDLIMYVNYGGELPEKPVILTFDDGYYNNFTYVYPILEKYDFKATFSVVGSYTTEASESGDEPNPNYSYMRWCDIEQMRDSGYAEICNHSFDMHSTTLRNGVTRMTGESYEDFRSVFLRDIFKLQDLCFENCDFRPNVFTYPFGACDESSIRLVKNCGFEASLGVEEKMNYIQQGNPDCLYNLCRYNREGDISTEDFMDRIL